MNTEDKKNQYILLDSAGIRGQTKRKMGAESFAVYRTIQAAWESDVIVLVFDATQPISHQDQVIAGITRETKKGVVIVANKADQVDIEGRKQFERDFYRKFQFLKVFEFLWISALEKKGLHHIWTAVDKALETREQKIDPEELRKLFNYLMKHKAPVKLRTEKRAVIYDLVFTKNRPPSFELLVKSRKSIESTYIKFLENVIRKQFNIYNSGISIKIVEVSKKQILGKV